MHSSDQCSNLQGSIVYTAVFGDIRDRLRVRPKQRADLAFVSFLDAKRLRKYRFFNMTRWRVTESRMPLNDQRRQARAHKVLAHKIFPHCSYSLWIDGCLQLIDKNIVATMEKHLHHADICVFKHKRRDCIYEELEACIKQQKDDVQTMTRQVTRYAEEGYPANNGLAETTAILRRHNKATEEFNERWWEEISKGSCRDQLSFNYIAWKLGMAYEVFPGNNLTCPYFKWFKH